MKLSPREREFLELVADASFTNPFSDDRVELEIKISGGPPLKGVDANLYAALDKIMVFLAKLEKSGKGTISDECGSQSQIYRL